MNQAFLKTVRDIKYIQKLTHKKRRNLTKADKRKIPKPFHAIAIKNILEEKIAWCSRKACNN